MDYGFLCAGVLYTSGLPTSYASRGIAAVLATTLRLEQRDLIFRRLIETGQFVFNVSDRGGMRVEGVGVRTTQQVRLMHAAIRHLILTPPRAPAPGAPSLGRTLLAMQWDPALGVPINQQELAWTLLTFSFSVLRALEQFGAVLTVEQKDAYIHLWSVVGHVLGVDGRLLCADFAEARALFERLEPRVTGNTPQGRGLITSLVDFTQPVLYPSFVRALIRYHVGERLAVLLGVRATGVGRLLQTAAVGTTRFLIERTTFLYRESYVLKWLGNQATRRIVAHLVSLSRAHGRAPFQLPKQLAVQLEPQSRRDLTGSNQTR